LLTLSSSSVFDVADEGTGVKQRRSEGTYVPFVGSDPRDLLDLSSFRKV
jgi:hypothetical protein